MTAASIIDKLSLVDAFKFHTKWLLSMGNDNTSKESCTILPQLFHSKNKNSSNKAAEYKV